MRDASAPLCVCDAGTPLCVRDAGAHLCVGRTPVREQRHRRAPVCERRHQRALAWCRAQCFWVSGCRVMGVLRGVYSGAPCDWADGRDNDYGNKNICTFSSQPRTCVCFYQNLLARAPSSRFLGKDSRQPGSLDAGPAGHRRAFAGRGGAPECPAFVPAGVRPASVTHVYSDGEWGLKAGPLCHSSPVELRLVSRAPGLKSSVFSTALRCLRRSERRVSQPWAQPDPTALGGRLPLGTPRAWAGWSAWFVAC